MKNSIILSAFAVFLLLIATTTPALAAPLACTLKLSATAVRSSANEATYSFSVKNTGGTTCTDVRLSVYYSENETFTKSTATPSAKTNYYWLIGKLAAGKTQEISVTTKLANPTISSETEACASATKSTDSCATAITKPITGTTPVIPVPPVVVPTPIPAPVPIPSTPVTTTQEYGVWVWDSPVAVPWEKNKARIDAAAAHGFNTIYVTVDDYLDTNSPATYSASVEKFIAYANSKGIAVDAEAGWRDWAKPTLRSKAYAILAFVNNYNSTHTAKFRNVQYDIEPYILPEYETNKGAVLTDFVTLTYELVKRNTGNAGITMVIPHFYGTADGWTPNVTYAGKTASTFTHLLTALDTKPGNSISIMAYRNYVEGKGGTLDIAGDEIREASTGIHSTKVIVAQETGNVDPGYVTFFGMSKAELQKQIGAIKNSYANSSGFGGIAVHYLDPYLELK